MRKNSLSGRDLNSKEREYRSPVRLVIRSRSSRSSRLREGRTYRRRKKKDAKNIVFVVKSLSSMSSSILLYSNLIIQMSPSGFNSATIVLHQRLRLNIDIKRSNARPSEFIRLFRSYNTCTELFYNSAQQCTELFYNSAQTCLLYVTIVQFSSNQQNQHLYAHFYHIILKTKLFQCFQENFSFFCLLLQGRMEYTH